MDRSFNTQPPEGGYGKSGCSCYTDQGFNTQPPEGGCGCLLQVSAISSMFQHAAARRRLGRTDGNHNRLRRFNTQPPEGGWLEALAFVVSHNCFNTQPPEGG